MSTKIEPENRVSDARDQALLPDLMAALNGAIEVGATIATVAQGRPNRVVSITEHGVEIETERSKQRTGGAELVPAWMLNVTWQHLQRHRTVTNAFILNELNVKRGAAVCALLAQIPAVDVVATRPITLVLRR